uniref:Uncharacterized protein n=2 Tax=Phyllobacteriaceae TaxID=69277 RepID=Q11BD2_CHESB
MLQCTKTHGCVAQKALARGLRPSYFLGRQWLETKMRKRTFISGISSFFGMVDSAMRVSNAVRNRAQPRSADLVRLGIDPDRFREITLL